MSPSEPYRKLPGGFSGVFRRHSIWLGPDHLLLVDSNRFFERYKRFYLPDIQTLVIRKTPRFVVPYYWIVIGLAALILLLSGIKPFRPNLFWPAALLLGAEAVYFYVASMFQSCTCHLITRVSNVELQSLFRLRSARQFVSAVAPRIATIQGNLPEGWVERSFTLEESFTGADRNPETPVSMNAGAFSWITVAVFVFVLIDALLTYLQLRGVNYERLKLPNVVNMVALAVCATISIVQLSRQKHGRGVRMMVLAGLLTVATVTYGATMVESFDQQFFHTSYSDPLDYPGMRPLESGEVVADIVIAAAGLILAIRQGHGPRIPASSFDSGAPPA